MQVLFVTDNPDNQVAFRCAGNRCLAAVFILFVVFSLDHTVHLRFVQGIDFVRVFDFLFQYALIQ